MFTGIHPMIPSDAELASKALSEEGTYRFPSFSANEAVTIGLSMRKRFRASSRHGKGKGMVISIQTIAGHTLFSCTVGDLGHASGVGDVSLDSWACLEGMINVVRRTGHSSYYVEKGMNAMGKSPKQMGIQGDYRINGGAYPIWLENSPCCPIAVAACYSGSSDDDHHLVVNVVRDYLHKIEKEKNADGRPSSSGLGMPVPAVSAVQVRESMEWVTEPSASLFQARTESPFEHQE